MLVKIEKNRSGMEPEKALMQDEILIRRFKDGNKASFNEMVIKYSPRLFRIAFDLLGNTQDAEEVVQDAFVRAYRALPEFRGDASFETWMHRITVNLARNKFHWNRRRGNGINISLSGQTPEPDELSPRSPSDVDVPDTRMTPDQMLENTEIERNILTAISRLPEKLREIMVLRHLEDLSYEDIAGLLNCKVGTVKSRLARGREMLRGILIEMGR